MNPVMEPERLPVQEQFRILLETFPAPDGHPYSLAVIARATKLSEQSLANLLDGSTQNPRLDTLRRLCRFYDISLDYFDCQTDAECRNFLAQYAAQRASPMVREIDTESETLTPSSKRSVLRLLDRLRHLRRSGQH